MEPLPNISEAAVALRSGRLTSKEVVHRCMERIDRHDSTIKAWVVVDYDRACMFAENADQELKSGIDRGPLHGIPIGVKDIIDVRGLPTRCGSENTSPDPRSTDAEVVANLRECGAIVLGKTVTCEWACFDPSLTRNPWNLERSPGGSSSGSAAAVAAGMCLGAIGTQTGGSILRPAAFCGVYGLKPSYGSISVNGVQALAPSLDHVGAIARTANDAWMLINGMRTLAARDPWSEEPLGTPPPLAIVDTPTDYIQRTASSDVAEVFRTTIEQLRRAGCDIGATEISRSIEDAIEDHQSIMAIEASLTHMGRSWHFGPRISELIELGRSKSVGDQLRAVAGKHAFSTCAEKAIDCGRILLMPSVSTTAPGLDTTGDSRFQAIWSLAGLPAITIPCGLASDGMPVGMQLIGRRNGERELCEVAAWCERVIGFEERPPLG